MRWRCVFAGVMCGWMLLGCSASQESVVATGSPTEAHSGEGDPWASFPEPEGGAEAAKPFVGQSPLSSTFEMELPVSTTPHGLSLSVGAQPIASAAVVDNVAYVGGGWSDSRFFAVDVTTGSTLWAAQIGDIGPAPAVVSEGRVAITTESCTLFVLDASTGQQMWSQWLGDPLMGQPAVAGGKVYVAYPQQEAYAFSAKVLANGHELWSQTIDADILSAPVVEEGAVYLTTQTGRVYKLDAENGEVVWARDVRATSAPWVEDLKVYVTQHAEPEHRSDTPEEGVIFLWADTGEPGVLSTVAWAKHEAPWLSFDEKSDRHIYQSALDARAGTGAFQPSTQIALDAAALNIGQKTVYGTWSYQGSRPVVAEDTLLTATAGRLYGLDPATGDVRWEQVLSTSGETLTPPAVAGHRVYTVSGAGELWVHDIESGEALYSAEIGAGVFAQPVIEDGRVVISTRDGAVHIVDTGHRDGQSWSMWGGAGRD